METFQIVLISLLALIFIALLVICWINYKILSVSRTHPHFGVPSVSSNFGTMRPCSLNTMQPQSAFSRNVSKSTTSSPQEQKAELLKGKGKENEKEKDPSDSDLKAKLKMDDEEDDENDEA